MRLQNFSTWLLSVAVLMPFTACAEEDDRGDDTAADTADEVEEGERESEDGMMSSSSEETCMSRHSCVGDSCVCETPGLEEMPCTNSESCDEECEFCE